MSFDLRVSLNGLNEVKWLPNRTLPTSEKETELSGSVADEDVSVSSEDDSTLEETCLEGELFKKTPVSSQMGGGVCGGIWVKRGFILDSEVGEISFYNEVGDR